MEKTPTRSLIVSPLTPLLLALTFCVAFFTCYFYFNAPKPTLQSQSVGEFFQKYALYIPLALSLILVVKGYVLYGLTALLHLRFSIARLIAYLLVYGTLAAIGVQLRYFEPRYTDIAKAIIDYYAFPLLVASVTASLVAIVFACIKKRA